MVVKWRSLLAAVLITSVAARGFEPTLLFNLDLGDMSSAVTYVPDFNLPPDRASWNTTFSDTSLSSYVEGMVGKGSALHNSYMVSKFRFTPVVGRFNFVGGGFLVRGSVTGDWTPDSSDLDPLLPWVCTVNNRVLRLTPPADDILVQNSTLPFGYQKIWMALEYGSWSLGAVTIMTGMVAEAQSIDDVPRRVETVASKGKINPFFTQKGDWTVSDHIGGVGGQDKIPYDHAVASSNTGAELSVTLPPKTSYIVINGTTGPAWDKLYINLSPAPPLNPVSFAWVTTRNKWVADSIVYAMPLDPRVRYNLSMAPALNSSVALHSVTLYSSVGIGKNNATAFNGLGTGERHSTNTGAIAGGVVGGVLGLALLLAGTFWSLRTYQRNKRAPLRFDRADDAAATPFIAPAGSYPPRVSPQTEKAGLYGPPDHHARSGNGYAETSFTAGETPSSASGASSMRGLNRAAVVATSDPPANHSALSDYKNAILGRPTLRQSSTASSEKSTAVSSGLPPGAAPR